MFSSPERTQRRWRFAGFYAAALGVIGVSWPAVASAHFILQQPPAYSVQDGLGSPQKSAPCGQADPGVPMQPSGMVTTFVQGQTFTLTIDEKVPHPGHYRVLIAADPSSLPADPAVTPGATPCGSTTITANPTLPLVADGLLAVCVQHELDHLNGTVFVDHLSQLKQVRIKNKLAKQARVTA